MVAFDKCEACGFWLWQPIAHTDRVRVGLYDDHRFPGRSLVVWDEHVEHLDDLAPDNLLQFMAAIQQVMVAIRAASGSHRVNVAILGNQEAHLHAHLIPRGGPHDVVANQAPWRHPESPQPLPDRDRLHLITAIGVGLREGDGWLTVG